jgi:hypothetical protein
MAEAGDPSGSWSWSPIAWDTPGHVVWNVLAVIVFGTALVGVLHPRSRPLRQGWASKVCWFLGLSVTLYVAGLYIPLGAVGVLVHLRRGWHEQDERRAALA